MIIANTKVYPRLKQVYEKINKLVKNSPQFIIILKPGDNTEIYKDGLHFSKCINQSVEDNMSFKPFEVRFFCFKIQIILIKLLIKSTI